MSLYTSFEEACQRLIADPDLFSKFRLNSELKIVVDTIDGKQGQLYIDELAKKFPKSLILEPRLLHLDSIGSPKILYYGGVKLSPLFARYIHQVESLKSHFSDISDKNIVEIGGGFGGHSCVLTEKYPSKSYTIIDLPSVSRLIEKYIETAELSDKITVYSNTQTEWRKTRFDLLVSHYCFSEIDAEAQDLYLNSVIKTTPRGFMICNIINRKSHHKNKIIKWITEAHPSTQVLDEVPLTYRGNYILVWDDTVEN